MLRSDNNVLKNNEASKNGVGIHLIISSVNLVENNRACYNTKGISLESGGGLTDYCGGNKLIDNVAEYNYDGIFLISSGSGLMCGNHLIGNKANNNANMGILLHWAEGSNVKKNTVNSNKYGIYIHGDYADHVAENTVDSNSECGIFVTQHAQLVTISKNTVSNNYNGILLTGSEVTLDGNTIVNNQKGMSISSPYCHILNNIVCYNGLGISLSSYSSSNWIHNNHFENDINAQDEGSNYWDFYECGNYYSDYTGTDSDGDGIGDTPYCIPGGSNKDNYPLVTSSYVPPQQDVDVPEFPTILIPFIVAIGLVCGRWRR